jgi:hypothetical protein
MTARMTQTRRAMFAVLAASSTLLVLETQARADDRTECNSAADQAQALKDEGKYRRAREQLLICARDVCPTPIKRDCLDWLTQVEATAPTVVFGAKDGTKDLSEVKVSVDGVAVTDRLDGKPVQMDLGKHVVKFDYQGQTKEEEVVIGAGQKNRHVTVTFGGAAAGGGGVVTPPPGGGGGESQSGSLVPAFVVGGIGVLALGSFAIFGLGGKSDVDELKDSNCKPQCDEGKVDSARTKLIIADISLGIGIVALGVATYMILTRPKIDVKTGSVVVPPPPKRTSGVTFDFGAVTGGAMGSVGARF